MVAWFGTEGSESLSRRSVAKADSNPLAPTNS